ncbi:hypothetical protein CP533_0693 [Ophiocordyceps camponoti-saundersi (nom. inval.)]|nr:hypothetical protein CP533_0693 [Ophiocordyceps camponoti-saundersi (nom. inval.)]
MTYPQLRTSLLIITLLTITLLLLTNRSPLSLSPHNLSHPPPTTANESTTIPNIVNLVHLLDPTSPTPTDLTFEFSQYLSVYAAFHHLHPPTILLHTDASALAISRARAGHSGKWTRLLLEMPGLVIKDVVRPDVTSMGSVIGPMEHKSDFVRVEALREVGGLYIDFDVFVLRSLRSLFDAGFGAVVGREFTDDINSGAFLTRPHGELITAWADDMPRFYDGSWLRHSNYALTSIAERLVGEASGDVLIMERNAFAPGGWEPQDLDRLWAVHDEGDGEDVSWPVDWSRTYLLHAFMPYRNKHPVHGFDRVDPRYVLERRSNFARALYPLVSMMEEKGLVERNDTFDGRE